MFGNLFNKSSFGLDIGDDSIKFAELINTKNGIKAGRHGEQSIPPGVIESGKIIDIKKLRGILLSLNKEKGIKSAYVSLPRIDTENIGDYFSAFKNSGIKVKSFEERSHAISRSVVGKGDFGTYMIVNFGRNSSNIFIMSGGAPMHHATASDDAYFLREEIARHFLNWHTEKDEGKIKLPIKKIILCGDAPNLAEFAELLSLHMRHKVETANVWINILDSSEEVPPISFEESFGFAPALGVALRGFGK